MRKDSRILWLDRTDSTNDEARRRIASLDNLSIVATRQQDCGRGQGSHVWMSEPGMNLTFSIVLKFTPKSGINAPGSTANRLRRLNAYVTGVLVAYLGEQGIACHVKEPNDIWCEDRKIAGILIENELDGDRVGCSIIGIGLNVNQTRWPAELPNPVSMAQKTGRSYILENELRRLSEIFNTQGEYLDIF